MKKKILITLIILIIATVAYAANVKWTALAELTAVNDADVLCIVDDAAGTPVSKKITVINLFDTIDTFSELDTIVADKSLVNLADGAVWLGVHDFGGVTSIELYSNAAPTTNATGEIALDTTIADHQPLWQYYDGGENMTVIAIDTAQLPALDNEIVKYDAASDKFVLEADAGAGATAWDDIGNPDADDTITLAGYEVGFSSTLDEAAHVVFKIDHTDADVAAATTIFQIQSVDDAPVNLTYIKIVDDTGVTPNTVFAVTADGATAMDGGVTAGGTVEGATLTEGGNAVYNSTETPGGELGGTWASPTIDDSLSVSSWTLVSPTFTTGITATDLIDSVHYVADSIDNEHINWANITNLGDAGTITVADTADATSFVALWESATGDLAAKSDGALLYAADTGTLAATQFSGGGASLTSIDAATGDSATAFFDAGTIEHEYGGIEANISAIADGGMLVGTGAGTMGIRASFLTGGAAGFLKHELGGLEADINAYTGLVAITGGATAEVDSKSELEGHIADVADFAEADGDVYTGNADFGGGDLELPQASPAVPDADGEIEVDFTDGKLVIQHGSAHAELGAATDVVVGTLINSWSGTIYEPDGVNDVITVKAINSIEFPHGVVITAIYLGVSSDTNYTLTIQNFDDFDTINGANGTIDTVTYTADATGEIIDTTPTYATISAGQIIMISIPSTNVDWIHFEIYFYEPAA